MDREQFANHHLPKHLPATGGPGPGGEDRTDPADISLSISAPVRPGGAPRRAGWVYLSASATEPTKSLQLAELRAVYRWDLLEARAKRVVGGHRDVDRHGPIR